jgi:hypothetical protein
MKNRQKNIEDEEVSLEDVRERQDEERRFFDIIIENFDVDDGCRHVIDNSTNRNEGKKELVEFIDSSVPSC